MSEMGSMVGLTRVSPRRSWTAEEADERRIELVKKFGQERLSAVATPCPRLTAKQFQEIRERSASGFMTIRPWTAEEDEMLRMGVQRFKFKFANLEALGWDVNSAMVQRIAFINWGKIAECFEDRTAHDCMGRWRIVLTLDLAKVPLSKEEDEIIIRLVKKYGQESWSTIAGHIPGRTGNQCRERWHNHLNPNINNKAWTQDEELALIRAHQIYGNKWEELAKFFPGRTENAIKNHWNSCVEKKLDM